MLRKLWIYQHNLNINYNIIEKINYFYKIRTNQNYNK